MELTETQYGILRASAHNVCMAANSKNSTDCHYMLYLLADQIAILTGKLPEEQLCRDVQKKAKQMTIGKSFEECVKNADKILALFIGSFTVEQQ